MISEFHGKYRWLSNFWQSAFITEDGRVWQTVEHAYQAAKTTSWNEQEVIRHCGRPGTAKKLGRRVKVRPDWEQKKVTYMRYFLRLKFANADMKALLLETGEEKLVEGNTWGDTFWGVCNGRGQNMLGRLLMEVRAELRKTRGE